MVGLQIPHKTDSEGGEDTGTSEAVKTNDGRLAEPFTDCFYNSHLSAHEYVC